MNLRKKLVQLCSFLTLLIAGSQSLSADSDIRSQNLELLRDKSIEEICGYKPLTWLSSVLGGIASNKASVNECVKTLKRDAIYFAADQEYQLVISDSKFRRNLLDIGEAFTLQEQSNVIDSRNELTSTTKTTAGDVPVIQTLHGYQNIGK